MESERELAASLFLDDPIHATIEDTHNCYNESVDYLLSHSTQSDLNVEVICGTHNQNSIVQAIASMNKYGIDRSADTICFAQLYGMSDELVSNVTIQYNYHIVYNMMHARLSLARVELFHLSICIYGSQNIL